MVIMVIGLFNFLGFLFKEGYIILGDLLMWMNKCEFDKMGL